MDSTMTPDQIQAALKRWDAPERYIGLAKGKDLPAIYACERGDWLYWLYWLLPRIRAPKNVCVQLAVDAARLALPHAGELRAVCLEAIKAAEAWLLDPSEDNVARCKAAARAAYAAAAYAAAADAAYAAAWAAWAADAAWAARAARAAARAAADAAVARAARAARAAARAAADAAVARAARADLADCFRARIPYAEFERLFTDAAHV